jgi:chromosome segregation protein
MVFLKKIELRGFKSMGSKLVSVGFEPGFTVITGPNGSGKSNIIDAVLFALGENSPKTLRVNKLTSLIYDGGGDNQKPNSTRVSITLDNSDRKLPVDSDVVLVSRELKQDGENSYFLNGKHIQKNALLDILQLGLLSSHGLNIVAQGMIMRISELAPEEKRKLIEQIVGVSQFDEKKEEAMKQLQDADLKLQIAMARIGEIKGNIESLEEERNDQLRLKQLEDQLRWAKAVISSRNIENAQRKIAIERQELERLLEASKELSQKLSTLSEEERKIESEKNAFVQSFVEEGGGKKVEIEFSIARLSQDIELIESETREASQTLLSLKEALPRIDELILEQEHNLAQKTEEVSTLQTRIAEIRRAKAEKENEISEKEKRIAEQHGDLEKARKEQESANLKVNSEEERTKDFALRIESLKLRKTIMEKEHESLKARFADFEKGFAKLNEVIKQISEGGISEAKNSQIINETQIARLEKQRKDLETALADSTEVLRKAEAEIVKLDIQRKVGAMHADSIQIAKKLEVIIERERVDGYIGILGSLIGFHPEYENVVYAACNKWLSAIVVQDIPSMVKVARCARLAGLRHYIILPVSEVPKDVPNSTTTQTSEANSDGVIGFLPDVITFDTRISPIVKFLFGRTLVVRSVRQAFSMSVSGNRAVSLTGEVFEPNLSQYVVGWPGYFGDKSGFDELLLTDEGVIADTRRIVQQLEAAIRDARQKSKSLNENLQALLTANWEKKLSSERARAKTETFHTLYRRYTKVNNSLKCRINKLEAAISGLNVGISKAEGKLADHLQKIERMKERFSNESRVQAVLSNLEVGNRELEILRGQLHDIDQSLVDLSLELSTLLGSLENSIRPTVERIKAQREEMVKQIQAKETKVSENKKKIAELALELDKLKIEEMNILESTRKSRPLLEGFDSKLKYIRSHLDTLRRSISSSEREIALRTKEIEALSNNETKFRSDLSLYGYSEPLEVFDECDMLFENLNEEYEALRNSVNLLADKNYREIFEGYKNVSTRRNQLERERDTIVRFIEDIDSEKKRIFTEAFTKIDRELRLIFNKITTGSAWLELENNNEIFSGGLFLMTQFPNKIPRESSAVSGGEKTVSALSFILAIQSCFPSPFYLFDEIDAHLDPVNSDRLGEMLAEKSKNSQIIIVSLKDSIVSRAKAAYGVYLTQGTSRIVHYRPDIQVPVS